MRIDANCTIYWIDANCRIYTDNPVWRICSFRDYYYSCMISKQFYTFAPDFSIFFTLIKSDGKWETMHLILTGSLSSSSNFFSASKFFFNLQYVVRISNCCIEIMQICSVSFNGFVTAWCKSKSKRISKHESLAMKAEIFFILFWKRKWDGEDENEFNCWWMKKKSYQVEQ